MLVAVKMINAGMAEGVPSRMWVECEEGYAPSNKIFDGWLVGRGVTLPRVESGRGKSLCHLTEIF